MQWLLAAIAASPGMTRGELAEAAQEKRRTRAQVDAGVRLLLKSGLVEERGEWNSPAPLTFHSL